MGRAAEEGEPKRQKVDDVGSEDAGPSATAQGTAVKIDILTVGGKKDIPPDITGRILYSHENPVPVGKIMLTSKALNKEAKLCDNEDKWEPLMYTESSRMVPL